MIDLEFLDTRPQLAPVLADTFWTEMAMQSDLSRRTRKSSLKIFSSFLDWKAKRGIPVSTLRDVTFELLGSFAKWLVRNRALSEPSAAAVYGSVAQLLKAARRLHPKEFEPDFEIPYHGLNLRSGGSVGLDQSVFAQILRVAEFKAEKTQNDYTQGDFPRAGHDLIPFMILIAAHTAINAFSLYELRRDCLEPHPIDDHSIYVTWYKARSSSGTQKQLHLKRTSRTVALINFILEYTKPLVTKAANSQQEFLFLYPARYHLNPNIVRVVAMRHFNNHGHSLKAFCERNNLPRFTFAQIRPAAATHNHLKNGGNLRKTQVLLGHKDIATTSIYLQKQILTPLYNASIRAAQKAMVARTTVIPKPAAEGVTQIPRKLSRLQRKSILKGEFNTGSGRCIDPRNSPQPGQRKGKICTLFLACLRCPNSLYFLEDLPRVISLANHLRSLKQSMTKDTWVTLYSEHLKVLEVEIIGAFSDKEIAAATIAASSTINMKVLMSNTLCR